MPIGIIYGYLNISSILHGQATNEVMNINYSNNNFSGRSFKN